MKVTLLGMGCGTEETMTLEAREALMQAEAIIAAKGLFARMPEHYPGERIAAVWPEDILEKILEAGDKKICVAFSGDSGFHSGTRNLVPLLREAGIPHVIMPGISSVQMLSARTGRPWQDWLLVSAHGKDCDPIRHVMQGRPVFFLTGSNLTPGMLCAQLAEAGLGDLPVVVGENLSYETEKITEGTAWEISEKQFAPLSVLLTDALPDPVGLTSGIADERFIRGDVPMTKQEIRAAIRAKLAVRRGEVIWDIGAGTGSVSVELAQASAGGPVYAVECSIEGYELIRKNREHFGVWNLHVIRGMAEDVIGGLPVPDAVFIGGSKGQLETVIRHAVSANPMVRICVSAILLETMTEAVSVLTSCGREAEVVQIQSSRAKKLGNSHMMMANNPVFLITG